MLTLDPRFGLGEPVPVNLTRRDVMLILGALSAQGRYMRNLAEQAKKRPYSDPETIGRNIVNALEVGDVADRLQAQLPSQI